MAMTHPAADGVEYQQRVDEDLVAIAKTGDNLAMEYLLNKYKNFVRIKAKSYFLIGADREDIIQEGMIGLYKAVRDFKADKLSSFRAFAELCITRQIITAIKTATRQKHIPLNQYISLNKPIYDEDSERTLLDVMASQKTSDPEELVVTQEVSDDIRQRIRQNLSELESQVLESYSKVRAIKRWRATSTGTSSRSTTPCNASNGRSKRTSPSSSSSSENAGDAYAAGGYPFSLTKAFSQPSTTVQPRS